MEQSKFQSFTDDQVCAQIQLDFASVQKHPVGCLLVYRFRMKFQKYLPDEIQT